MINQMKTKKSLGQYFLTCGWAINTLLKAADLNAKDSVLEIGPGTGILTRPLAKAAGKVMAVEKDEELACDLRQTLRKEGIENVEIITGDILKFLVNQEFPRKLQTTNYKLVANIPYYLTSRLLRLLLDQEYRPQLIILTIQKEVAERITAQPPQMSLLGVSVQVFGKPKLVASVPASCFVPRPKVDSAILSISDISDSFFLKNGLNKEIFFKVVKQGFSQKRKMLANTLKKFGGKENAEKILRKLNLASSRPQELSPQDWAQITLLLPKRAVED